MSNDTRTMLVVLLVCGLLMCGCILVPIGVGAAFFLTASRQAQVAQAEAQRAVAADQARFQEMARAQTQAQADAIKIPPVPPPGTLNPQTGLPALPPVPTFPIAPTLPTPTTPPPDLELPIIPGLPGGDSPAVVPPEVIASLLASEDQRRALYQSFKQLRAAEEQMKSLGATDPTAAASLAIYKQQIDGLMKTSGITREQIDKILAEGDKAGW